MPTSLTESELNFEPKYSEISEVQYSPTDSLNEEEPLSCEPRKRLTNIFHTINILPNSDFKIYVPIDEETCIYKLFNKEIKREDLSVYSYPFECDETFTNDEIISNKNFTFCKCNIQEIDEEPVLALPLYIKLAKLKQIRKNVENDRIVGAYQDGEYCVSDRLDNYDRYKKNAKNNGSNIHNGIIKYGKPGGYNELAKHSETNQCGLVGGIIKYCGPGKYGAPGELEKSTYCHGAFKNVDYNKYNGPIFYDELNRLDKLNRNTSGKKSTLRAIDVPSTRTVLLHNSNVSKISYSTCPRISTAGADSPSSIKKKKINKVNRGKLTFNTQLPRVTKVPSVKSMHFPEYPQSENVEIREPPKTVRSSVFKPKMSRFSKMSQLSILPEKSENEVNAENTPKFDKIKSNGEIFFIPKQLADLHNVLTQRRETIKPQHIFLIKALLPEYLCNNNKINYLTASKAFQILIDMKHLLEKKACINTSGQIVLKAIGFPFREKKYWTKEEMPKKISKLLTNLYSKKTLDKHDIVLAKILLGNHIIRSNASLKEIKEKLKKLANDLRSPEPLNKHSYNMALTMGIIPSLMAEEYSMKNGLKPTKCVRKYRAGMDDPIYDRKGNRKISNITIPNITNKNRTTNIQTGVRDLIANKSTFISENMHSTKFRPPTTKISLLANKSPTVNQSLTSGETKSTSLILNRPSIMNNGTIKKKPTRYDTFSKTFANQDNPTSTTARKSRAGKSSFVNKFENQPVVTTRAISFNTDTSPILNKSLSRVRSTSRPALTTPSKTLITETTTTDDVVVDPSRKSFANRFSTIKRSSTASNENKLSKENLSSTSPDLGSSAVKKFQLLNLPKPKTLKEYDHFIRLDNETNSILNFRQPNEIPNRFSVIRKSLQETIKQYQNKCRQPNYNFSDFAQQYQHSMKQLKIIKKRLLKMKKFYDC